MKSINRALDVLGIFMTTGNNNGIRFSEIAKLSKLNKATASRIISTLTDRGYLYQSEPRGKYFLGVNFRSFTRIMIKSGMNVRDITMPHLTKLADSVQECAILAGRYGEKLIINEIVNSKQLLRADPEANTEMPLYCTALGKTVLAHMKKEELEHYLDNINMKKYTEKTITDVNHLKKDLTLIVKEGIAYENEEQCLGIRGIAAPINDPAGRILAAVGITGPTVRLSEAKIKEAALEVKYCAAHISKDLGYQKENMNQATLSAYNW